MKNNEVKDRLVKGKYVIFNGKKFYPPYLCLCCGVEVSEEQFCFSRICGYCDSGKCQGFVGHNRKDIFENADDVGDEFEEMIKEKVKQIKELK